jgi:hypothetical protein
MLAFVVILISSMALAQQESYSGDGFMECYGEMEVTLDRESGEGFMDCKPKASLTFQAQVRSAH